MSTKTKKRKKAKVDPLKQFFRLTKDGKPYPKKLRTAVMRELDEERRKFENTVKEYHTKVVQSPHKNPFEHVQKLPKLKSRLITLFDEHYTPSQNFQFPDLMGGKQKTPGKLVKIIWPEKSTIKKADSEKLQESMKFENLTAEQFGPYLEKAKTAWKTLKESGINDELGFQGIVGVGREDTLGKFFPYPPNSFTRQMYVPDSWFMLARCAHVYNFNPLAKAIIDIKTAFVIGTGPRLVIKNNSALSDMWKTFEKKEDFVETLRVWCSMLGTNGELFVEFYKSIIDSLFTVRSIDPGHVYEIITEPRDIRTVYGYKLMYQTANQIFTTGANGEQVLNSEWIYETVPPDNIMHVKINIQENEKRGRSDLLCILAICQLFEDYINYKVLRTIVEAAFAWDVEMKGADQSQIDSFLSDEEQAFPRPGSTRGHNENVKWTAMGNTGASGNEDVVFEMLLTIAAVGGGVPKEYMGAGRTGTRANAITSTEPSVKNFESRRHKLEGLILRILDYLAKGNNIQYDPGDVEVAWPAIAPEDVDKIIDLLYTALDRDTLTKQMVDEAIAKHLDFSNYDWNEVMQERLKEKMGPGIVKSLADGSPPMVGTGIETPELGKPVVGQPKPAPGAAVGTTATPSGSGSGGMSGTPPSLGSADRIAAKKAGQAI